MKLTHTTRVILCIAMFCTVWAWHFLFAVMFLPSMIAICRGHKHCLLIVLGNVFLGWTPFWIILVVIAAWHDHVGPARGLSRRAVRNEINHAVKNDDGTVRI